MEIECQGCLYTVCSFICLTEDLSNILDFLWRHGCLRKSYLCEKCGRKCAIGDKELFFRCNRYAMEAAESDQELPSTLTVPPTSSTPRRNASVAQENYDLPAKHYCLSYYQDLPPFIGGPTLVHPALRHTMPLPGDPQPPTLPSPVFPSAIYKIETDNRGQKISLQGDEMAVLDNSELEDLDAGKQSRKRVKNSPFSSKKRCNFKVSMKKGTIFEKSKLPIDTVCKFILFWCCMKQPTQDFLRSELSLASRTVVDWSTTCREICIHWAKQNSEKIGGVGVVVQVDEVKVLPQTNQNKPGEVVGHGYSFWGLEKEKGKLFIVPVSFCDAWSLLSVLNTWVHPGSIIVSNCWKNYDCLKIQEFAEHAAAHTKTFVHPINNYGTNSADGESDATNGKKTEEMHMPRFGTRRSHHLGDLAEFMFKRRYCNHLERMHAFFKQVAVTYPLR